MSNFSSRFGSMHRDLLDAEPESEESKQNLLNEIKNRAKRLFSGGNYPEAELLYGKGIEIAPDAIFYANRSAARLNLGRGEDALEDAKQAIKMDSSYSKGYYREGQAYTFLKEFDKAHESFNRGSEIEPENRTFKSMASKALEAKAKHEEDEKQRKEREEQMREKDNEREEEELRKNFENKSLNTTSVPYVKPVIPSSVSSKEGTTSSSSSTTSPSKSTTKSNGSDSSELRGYKTLADGRKTTYFNRELTEADKALIGDIAPKKIETNSSSSKEGPQAGSAWNYAGTFEDKNKTDWAKGKLKGYLKGSSFNIPVGNGLTVDVTKVKDFSGDASVIVSRGKTKYLFDFSFSLEWKIRGLDNGAEASGTLKYPDVTPDCDEDEDYDTILEVDKNTPPEVKPLIDSFIKTSSDGIQKVIRAQIESFKVEYQSSF